MNLRASTLFLVLALGVGGVAEAQLPTSDDKKEAIVERPVQAGTAGTASVSEPTKDLFDLIRDLRHKPAPPPPGPDDYKKRMIAAAPVVTYNPTSGAGIGMAGNVASYHGSPDTTRISSLVASVIGTSKKQLLLNGKINQWSLENRWHTEGDNRLYWTSQKTYGLGSDTLEGDAVNQKYDAVPVLRHDLSARGSRRLSRRRVSLQHPPRGPAGRRRGERGVAGLAIRGVLGAVRVRPRVTDVGRLHRARAPRQP